MTDPAPSRRTRQQIARFLPRALGRAIQSYESYAEKLCSDTEKFADYHKEGKVAAAHIQLLARLAEWAEIDTEDTQRANALLRSEALVETNAYYAGLGPDISET